MTKKPQVDGFTDTASFLEARHVLTTAAVVTAVIVVLGLTWIPPTERVAAIERSREVATTRLASAERESRDHENLQSLARVNAPADEDGVTP